MPECAEMPLAHFISIQRGPAAQPPSLSSTTQEATGGPTGNLPTRQVSGPGYGHKLAGITGLQEAKRQVLGTKITKCGFLGPLLLLYLVIAMAGTKEV